MKRPNIKEWVVLAVVSSFAAIGFGQKAIDLEEALSIARTNYPGLERDRLTIAQYNKLASTGIPVQPAQIYISSEEFGPDGQTGVHSLNIQQNFYLPKASKAQRDYYQNGAKLAERELALTDAELKREVGLAYYRLLYTKESFELASESADLYDGFLAVTTAQLESGETGRLPRMAARSRMGQAELEREQTRESFQIARSLFNQWLGSDTLYEAKGVLSPPSGFSESPDLTNNPYLNVIEAKIELADAKVETQKTKLLPQLNSGAKLQNAFGNFPLFGFQLGVNFPLFKKAYHAQIEAAEIGVMVQEATLKTERLKLERTIGELHYQLENQQEIMGFIRNDLVPLVNEQSKVNLQAYREGEIGYLEYLDSLEQVVKVKQQFLEALYRIQVLKIEIEFWTGS